MPQRLMTQKFIFWFNALLGLLYIHTGGEIAGKAVCEDLCYSGNSCTSCTGPALNPHDKTRTAGGSSSGSGILVSVKSLQ